MATISEITPTEQADRLAIRELVDAYAHCADRRDAEGQKGLFTEDTRFVVYMDGQGSEATYALEGREALTPVFEDLNLSGDDALQWAEHDFGSGRPGERRELLHCPPFVH